VTKLAALEQPLPSPLHLVPPPRDLELSIACEGEGDPVICAAPMDYVAPAQNTVDPTLPVEGIDLRAAVARFEESLIRQALARTNGNKNRAAKLLGMNRTTLVERMKRKPLV
jgi:DNA-binding NtrC family response regulator